MNKKESALEHYYRIRDRIDSLVNQQNKKILKWQSAIKNKRYGLAEVFVEEILDIKTLIRANEDVLIVVFEQTPQQGYYIN